MSNTIPTYRLPAEWEYDGAILLAWPHADTDWAYMLDEATDCFIHIVEAIVPYQKVIIVAPDTDIPRSQLKHLPTDRVFFAKVSTNDTWARDFGPMTMNDGSNYMVCDFKFNGWGLKFPACYDNLITQSLCAQKVITAPRLNYQDFVLEGGGIESDGCGTLMTTAYCQLSPNRNATLSKGQIIDRLKERLNAKKVLWLEHGALTGDDTDSHIDTLARFALYDTILYTGCNDPSDEHYQELQLMKQELMAMRTLNGSPYNLIELPLPDPIFDENGYRLPATYANFLATPHAVIMPSYGQPQKDKLAKQIIQIAFNTPVITVDCNALIKQHGSLHCVTMQLPQQILSI